MIRPEAATILPEDAAREVPNLAPGILLSASFRGSFYLLHTEHPGDVVLVSEAPATDLELPAAGSPLLLHLNPAAITLLR